MRHLLSVLSFCLLLLTAAAAQETRGTISGTVQDAQGVVPGATVKITNVDTGYFEAPLLQPGTYRIVVEMASFKTITRDGLALAVGQQINIPFTLEVGSINEQVTVTGVAPVLDTTSVSSGANFDTQQINALPMFSNMPVGLARFAPGVNPDNDQPPMSQGFVTGPSEASGTAIGGVGSNTYTIDGATNAGFNRQLSTSPNADMVQEMRVETSNFDASNGHGLGNQISMMTRAGTNATRGTINYQYWTNTLNALNDEGDLLIEAAARRVVLCLG